MTEEELLGRMDEMFRRHGELTARLVDEKIAGHMTELRGMVAKAGDAGHAAVTRAARVERKLENHEQRLRRLEQEHGLDSPAFEDDFPLRSAGE